MEKVNEELSEVEKAARSRNSGKVKEEIGDLLFSVINLSRLLNVNPVLALSSANDKFVRRFKYMESKGINRRNMESLWNEAKKEENNAL
jgi:tetrapyrrole methylase family protein/MazG family protein